ncbi:hypothetical protein [Castellaniella defragrans]|uniref:hypothetical protein n=1 Tax=Castellaniella defragrans TaxID=75697 RepID=UPI00147909D6|nr:hypothetical protein [Castellaniella defragrans]
MGFDDGLARRHAQDQVFLDLRPPAFDAPEAETEHLFRAPARQALQAIDPEPARDPAGKKAPEAHPQLADLRRPVIRATPPQQLPGQGLVYRALDAIGAANALDIGISQIALVGGRHGFTSPSLPPFPEIRERRSMKGG